MTVLQLSQKLGLTPLHMAQPQRSVQGCYIGDLLSWVMGRAQEDNAWITIMSNVNILAVASLVNVSCIILAEGVMPEQQVLETAKAKGINLLQSSGTAYETATALFAALQS